MLILLLMTLFPQTCISKGCNCSSTTGSWFSQTGYVFITWFRQLIILTTLDVQLGGQEFWFSYYYRTISLMVPCLFLMVPEKDFLSFKNFVNWWFIAELNVIMSFWHFGFTGDSHWCYQVMTFFASYWCM